MKTFDREKTILTIITRTIIFPFVFGLAFFGAFFLFCQWTINFIRFGGEAIAYTSKTRRKTIADVFNKLNEIIWKN